MNAAIVKLSSLGDVVHALPVAAALRAARPEARVTWLVERRESAVVADSPVVDEVITVDTRRWRRARTAAEAAAAARAALGLMRELKARPFDIALDLQGLLKSGILTALTRAPLRIGLARRRCREPLSALFTTVRVDPPAGARHVVDQLLALLGPLGIAPSRADFALPPPPGAAGTAGGLLARAGLSANAWPVVINPGAGQAAKQWPSERFARLAWHLATELDVAVVVTWGPGEDALARAVTEGAGHPKVIPAPPTDLRELRALLGRVRLVIAGDTGPLHLAAALGTPCLGLFGPTDPTRNGPYGTGHAVLRGTRATMASLDTEAVLAAARACLGR